MTSTASVLLADNPGPKRLEGTNTWVLRGPCSAEMVVVDPGPAIDDHIDRIAALGKIALILVSHRHSDHSAGIDRLVELTGAPVRAVGRAYVRGPGGCLSDGEVIDAAGLRISVLATPGHTADSVAFVLDDAVLTADTILGRGTALLDKDDGDLGEYLESLRRLEGLGPRAVLPGHGPNLSDLRLACNAYLTHRLRRLDQIRSALKILDEDADVGTIVDHVYPDIDPGLRKAAESSVQTQLRFLGVR